MTRIKTRLIFADTTLVRNPLAALLLALALGSPAFSQAGEPKPDCTKLLETIQSGDFKTERGFASYVKHFGAAFEENLHALGPNDVWLDAGSGDTIAMTEYLAAKDAARSAKGIAVTFTAPDENLPTAKTLAELKTQGRVDLITGAFFENIPGARLGKPKLITDLFGISAYAQNVDVVLNRYLDLLDPGGSLYIFTLNHRTVIETAPGKAIGLLSYLEMIPGIKVTRYFPERVLQADGTRARAFGSGNVSVRIQKTKDYKSGSAPALKLMVIGNRRRPPLRYYKLLLPH